MTNHIKQAINYELSILALQAEVSASDTEADELAKAAARVAVETQFTAERAIEAMRTMVAKGLTVPDILRASEDWRRGVDPLYYADVVDLRVQFGGRA